MIFAFGDAAIIDDVSYCAEGSDGCDVISGDIFDFKVGPAFVQKPSDPLPEPELRALDRPRARRFGPLFRSPEDRVLAHASSRPDEC